MTKVSLLTKAALSSLILAALSTPLCALAQSVGSKAEWFKPAHILVHTPQDEVFLGVVHPAAALFERAFSLAGAQKEHEKYIELLTREGAKVQRVVDVLLAGTVDNADKPVKGPALDALRAFAKSSLTYDTSALKEMTQADSDKYKDEVIAALHPKELVKIILQRPTVHLFSTGGHNTGVSAKYETDPVMNLYFLRDQMITTAKGVVLSHMNAVQRSPETEIIKFALTKLNIQPIHEVSGEGRLEGGDFLPAGDTAFLGNGLRTNQAAVDQLLQKDVFGTQRVVIVKDPWKHQEQMHLDTYFNIISPTLATMVEDRMDVRDASGKIVSKANPQKRPSVDVYEKSGTGYKRIVQNGDFQDYLEKQLGFKLIPVSSKDQLAYGINYLTVAPGRILGIAGVSEEYKARLKNAGVQATWMDFYNLTGGYGAAHCTTQVLRREPVGETAAK